MKQIVDNYEKGKVSPKCQFSANAIIPDGEEVPRLQHQAALLGAKYPDNIITFDITPPRVISGMYTLKFIADSQCYGVNVALILFQKKAIYPEKDQHLNQVHSSITSQRVHISKVLYRCCSSCKESTDSEVKIIGIERSCNKGRHK